MPWRDTFLLKYFALLIRLQNSIHVSYRRTFSCTICFRTLPISVWLTLSLGSMSVAFTLRICLTSVQRQFRRFRWHRSYSHRVSSLLRCVTNVFEFLLHDCSELWKTKDWRCSDKRCKLWCIASKLLSGIACGAKVVGGRWAACCFGELFRLVVLWAAAGYDSLGWNFLHLASLYLLYWSSMFGTSFVIIYIQPLHFLLLQ